MILGKVIGNVVSTIKHPAYANKPVYLVQPIDLNFKPKGNAEVAVDYVSAGIGDIVLFGGAPGVAKEVFSLEMAPIRNLIMAIVDIIEDNGKVIYKAGENHYRKLKNSQLSPLRMQGSR